MQPLSSVQHISLSPNTRASPWGCGHWSCEMLALLSLQDLCCSVLPAGQKITSPNSRESPFLAAAELGLAHTPCYRNFCLLWMWGGLGRSFYHLDVKRKHVNGTSYVSVEEVGVSASRSVQAFSSAGGRSQAVLK